MIKEFLRQEVTSKNNSDGMGKDGPRNKSTILFQAAHTT